VVWQLDDCWTWCDQAGLIWLEWCGLALRKSKTVHHFLCARCNSYTIVTLKKHRKLRIQLKSQKDTRKSDKSFGNRSPSTAAIPLLRGQWDVGKLNQHSRHQDHLWIHRTGLHDLT
jgi:hypothetical protein